jgi:hypothetical protein
MQTRRNKKMAVAIDLSTAGIRVGYAFESTSGVRPQSNYVNLPNPKSIPDMNPEPNALDITSLNDTEWKRYMEGLKDMGGSLGLTFGMSEAFFDLWETICDTDDANKANGLRTWFVFYVPGLTNSFLLPVDPSRIGMPSAEVDSVLDVTVNVLPIGEPTWETAVNPTDAASA